MAKKKNSPFSDYIPPTDPYEEGGGSVASRD
jgi:hypothetical protein